jgi:hypothetical protein
MLMKKKWENQFKHFLLSIRAKFTRQSAKRYLYLGIFTGVFAVSLPFLDYIHQDVTISTPGEIILICLFFVVIGLIILATYSLWLKSNAERLLATLVLTYGFTEQYGSIVGWFGWLSSRVGSAKSAVIAQFSVYLIVGLLAKLVYAASKKLEQKGLTKGFLETAVRFACVFIAVINLYAFLSYVFNHHAVSSYKQPKTVDGVSSLNKVKTPPRDIYYLVFDRYASEQSLQANFNFDNSGYIDWLKKSGFVIRDDAFSNYQFTAPSVASTLRMDYHSDLSKDFPGGQPNNVIPYKNLIQNSQALSLLHKSGYDVYNVGNWWNITRFQKDATNISPLFRATVFGKSFNLSELQSKDIDKSFLGGFLKHGISISGLTFMKVTNGAPRDVYLKQLEDVKTLASQPHTKPRVVFAHFLNTHPPYAFNADGSPTNYDVNDNNTGASRSDKYINQLKFANSSTQELIKTIQQKSKTAPVILIQADEGPYPLSDQTKWQKAPDDTLKLKFGILAAYNLPGVSPEKANQIGSSVNIFRFVFNNYFDTKFKYLPDCSYVYNPEDNKPFVFYDITKKLHPANNSCENYK